MKEIEIKITVNETEYRAARNEAGKVSIDRRMPDGRWEWCGNGDWDGGITDCSAHLGDDVYAALDAAITAAE